MRTRFAHLLTVGWLAGGSAFADTPKIDRSIDKEPLYQTKAPKYGLLLFGPEGRARVWLVLDGDTLYVDRNGNGNLAEAEDKVAAEKKPNGRSEDDWGYSFDVGELAVGGLTHKGLRVQSVPLKAYTGSLSQRPDVKSLLANDTKVAAASVSVDVQVPGVKGGSLGGRVAFSAGPVDPTGVFRFADTPAEAPAVHLGGPLQITFYSQRPTLRIDREGGFVLVVGTPGIGPGTFANLAYEGTIPEDAKPMAEVILPAARHGGPPVKQKMEIRDRC